MTRKDYVRFAAMFKSILSNDMNYEARERLMVKLIARQTAKIFLADNSAFSTASFLKACGVKS